MADLSQTHEGRSRMGSSPANLEPMAFHEHSNLILFSREVVYRSRTEV